MRILIERIASEAQTRANKGAREFEAIPFEFHKLQELLSKIPGTAVRSVLEQYHADATLFAYRGARLLKNIFPMADLRGLVNQLLAALANLETNPSRSQFGHTQSELATTRVGPSGPPKSRDSAPRLQQRRHGALLQVASDHQYSVVVAL